ncbi:hypothetical protein BGZ76_009551 [Entomortierella beljakovae]|nr:hypothetical protein BGZ76_009551 [Entomortierella beljakovae]
MSLAGSIITLRIILIFGTMLLYSIFSSITLTIERRRYKYGHAPSDPNGGDSRSKNHRLATLVQSLFVLVLSGGLIFVTVPSLISQRRSVFVLPYPRNSNRYQNLDKEYSGLNPMNLRHCPSSTVDDPLTLICPFEGGTISAGIVIAGFAIVEALSVLSFYRRSSSSQSKYGPGQGIGHTQYIVPESPSGHAVHPIGHVGHMEQGVTSPFNQYNREMENVPLTEAKH